MTPTEITSLIGRIFKLEQQDDAFQDLCLEVFAYQAVHNAVYRSYIQHLGVKPEQVTQLQEIPFLPIDFFKHHRVVSGEGSAEIIFTSSGTTGSVPSRHEVLDLSIYRESYRKAFEMFYGHPGNMAILALLPAYLEREGSSLIYMVDDLIHQSLPGESGYFLHNHEALCAALRRLQQDGTPTLLLGVTYALLDFADYVKAGNDLKAFPELIVMETGGMKGRRKEMVREEVHEILQEAFHGDVIHSEYGMTELLSQAYSKGGGRFSCPPWMKVLIRDTNDPFSYVVEGQSGGLNIVDLANVHSCSFIATQDLGRRLDNNSFEVLGRFDHSDTRGCNLLIA